MSPRIDKRVRFILVVRELGRELGQLSDFLDLRLDAFLLNLLQERLH